VQAGEFREDLYYRLNVVHIAVPPLRERSEDIPLLAGRLLEKLGRRMGRRIEGISPEALRKLQAYPFPGNVRELENLLERACILAGTGTIEASDLDLGRPPREGGQPATLQEIERRAILAALQRWEGNRTRAAQELGISRRSLQYKLKEYGAEQAGQRPGPAPGS
jgi:DNA-binding NtrC family response regulator